MQNSILKDKNTLIIFAYANVGFGHLRVSDTLSHELNHNSNYVYLSGEDKVVSFFHRITSIHPILRSLLEWLQTGKQEDVVTFLYRSILILTAGKLEKKLRIVVKQAKNPIKNIVVIATHFSLAHQIAKIREKIEMEKNIRLFLFVQVTDDSPQHMWCVFGADLIFVPSIQTKKNLVLYSKNKNIFSEKIKVTPYPVSSMLTEKLKTKLYENRLTQFDPKSKEKIKIIVPISGAAVGMKYLVELTEILFKRLDRINFHIILKRTPYTSLYTNLFEKFKFVNIHRFKKDTEVVDEYEKEYKRITFGYEITKPSEQAFKSLINTDRVGGSILLFTDPVGRQEHDNLMFLKRHKLIPDLEDQKYLWQASINNFKLNNEKGRNILKKASTWRGIRLFKNPNKSANFIEWCLKRGVFKKMGKCIVDVESHRSHKKELMFDGAKEFWREVEAYLNKNKSIS